MKTLSAHRYISSRNICCNTSYNRDRYSLRAQAAILAGIAILLFSARASGVSAGESLSGPLPPLSPVIFEIAGENRFEVLWFHPKVNRIVLGNLETSNPARYAIPHLSDDEAALVSFFPLQAPVVIRSIMTLINPGDPYPVNPGDQFSPLDVIIGASRMDILAVTPTAPLARADSASSDPRVELVVNEPLLRGDAVFVALRWGKGTPTNPLVGVQPNLGSIESQEIAVESGSGVDWEISLDAYSLETEFLLWTPDQVEYSAINGEIQLSENAAISAFEIWYGTDSLGGVASSFSAGYITSDSLRWGSEIWQDGFVSVIAVDTTGQSSEATRVPVRVDSFGKLEFSPLSLEFDWSLSASRSQRLQIENLTDQTVTLSLFAERSLVRIEPPELTVAARSTQSVNLTLLREPTSGVIERFAIYAHDNIGGVSVIVPAVSLPNLATSVAEDSPLHPVSFELSNVYPNPSRGKANLSLVTTNPRSFTVEIYNVLGQVLEAQSYYAYGRLEVPINLETTQLPLAAGIYFVRVTAGQESLMRKFVLLR